ncbi:MAG TPA: hypothetical protein VHZ54_17730 [Solirubrobacterales bacterium]|nr:hypothetical protein [Solirubrobacterales bacterium]
MSEHTYDPRLEDDAMESHAIETDRDEEVLAPRPRGRLLRPLPLFLVALTIGAAGFLGGVLAQKGSEGAAGAAAGPGAGGLPSFAAAKSGGGSEGGATEAGGAATSGTVTSVEGHTIFVKETDGTVVAVKAGDGSTVTRDSNVSAKKIHPGDTVTVEGSKRGSTVRASSIAATESDAGATVESLFEE